MSNSRANTCQIVLGPNGLEYTREPVISNSKEIILYKFITNLMPIYEVKPNPPEDVFWTYRFDVMTVISIQIKYGKKRMKLAFELQEITNQAGWSTGTLAGLKQAVADIGAMIPVGGNFLLQENGFAILQEDGSKIII